MSNYTINLTAATAPERAAAQTNLHKWLALINDAIHNERGNMDTYGGDWAQLAADRGIQVDGTADAAAAQSYYNNLGVIYDALTNAASTVTPAQFSAAWQALINEPLF